MLKLLIQDDEGRKTLVPFSRDEITIGREDGNTIRLTERNVSRRHARLFRHSAQIFIEDLKSHNGIHVNGRRISGQAVIRKGDTIGIGDYDIIVDGTSSTPPLPSLTNKHTISSSDAPPLTVLLPEPKLEEKPSSTESPPVNTEPAEHIEHVHVTALPQHPHPEKTDSTTSANTLLPPKERSKASRASTAASVASLDTFDLPPRERPTIRLPDFVELSEEESPRLVALNLDVRGREFPCARNEFALGRSKVNDLVLSHSSVAPIHCRIERDTKNRWYLALNPQYPVLVNGRPYGQSPLKNGDILTLGKQELQFFLPSSQTAAVKALATPKKPFRIPLWVGIVASIFVMLGFVYFYWKAGIFHQSSWLKLNDFSYKYLPLPPYLADETPTPLVAAMPQDAPSPSLNPTAPKPINSQTTSPPSTSETAPHPLPPPPKPPEVVNKSEKVNLNNALQPSSKPQETTPSKFDKALEKPAARSVSKAAAPPATTARTHTKAARAPKPNNEAATTEPTSDFEASFSDMDLFWEDVYFLQKKAERDFTAADKRATFSKLHDKLSGCETARCAYELAKTSFQLSKLSHLYKTRHVAEFEAYLAMQDKGRQSRIRKEDACKILLNHYTNLENTDKIQALSEICTR